MVPNIAGSVLFHGELLVIESTSQCPISSSLYVDDLEYASTPYPMHGNHTLARTQQPFIACLL